MSLTWFALPPPVELGEGWSLRFLTANQMLECRGEGEAMAKEERDKALWANAALLSKVLLREGKPAFEGGEEVLASLTVGQIEGLTRRWWEQDNFSPQPLREERIAQEGGENERFDMARFLELGGTAEEPFRDLALEGAAPARGSAVPELWPQRGRPPEVMAEVRAGESFPAAREFAGPGVWPRRNLPTEVWTEMQRSGERMYIPPDQIPRPRTGGTMEGETTGSLPDDGAEKEAFPLPEAHQVVQMTEPEPVPESAGLTVGELDRAVERDARRYGGGFSLL